MNFRRDSDIIDSYGAFVGKSGENPPVYPYAYSKKPTGILNKVLVISIFNLTINPKSNITTNTLVESKSGLELCSKPADHLL